MAASPVDENIGRVLARNGLSIRRWTESDSLDELANIINRSRIADGVEDFLETPEDLKLQFEGSRGDAHLVIRERKAVGACRLYYEHRPNGTLAFVQKAELVPEARGEGVREALLLWNERYAREVSPSSTSLPREKQAIMLWANDEPNEWKDVAVRNGYEPAQHVLSMERPLESFPSMDLPKGFEIRPVRPDQYPEVWKARRIACMHEWDFSEESWDRKHYEEWLRMEEFQPELWQVAWHGDILAGMILNFILESENRGLGRRRGHTEHVYVNEQFRRRGLARALLASSFRVLRERGAEVAALDTEVENPNETVGLYGSMGFKAISRLTWYMKPL